jgi:hypothetical protein
VLPWFCRFAAGLSPQLIGASDLPGFLQSLAERLQRFELFRVLLLLCLFSKAFCIALCVIASLAPLRSMIILL